MAKMASCKATGLNCDFVIQGETEEELLNNAAQHGRDAHRIGETEEEANRTYGQDFLAGVGAEGAGVVGQQATVLNVKRNERRLSESGRAKASHA